MIVVPDFETISQCDLKEAGSWRYAEDPTTAVLCLCWEVYTDDMELVTAGSWVPGEAEPAWPKDAIFTPHNCAFEKAIWRHIMVPMYGWSDIPDEKWDDTLATCAMKAIPQDLDGALRCLGLEAEKDMEGNKLTIGLSKTHRKTGMMPAVTPPVIERVVQYCGTDVTGQAALRTRIGTLTPAERQVWLLDQTINQRGIGIDLDLVSNMQRIVDDGTRDLLAEFKELTGLQPGQVAKFRAWLNGRHVDLPNLQAETVAEALGSSPDIDPDDLDPLAMMNMDPGARRALEVRQLVTSAAIKKLERAQACTMADGRARGLLQYHAAGPGRWAGRIVQPHNFPRPTLKEDGGLADPDGLVQALMTGDAEYVELLYGPAVPVVVSSLRHILKAADGHQFIAGDFSGIEARVVLALAGQWDKVALMASGADVYCDMASDIYGRPINKKEHPEERQTGKNSVLGLGFQMGKEKFQLKYAKNQPLEFCAQVVDTYRTKWAPNVPKLWYALKDASTAAVWGGGPQEAFGVRYALEDGWLTARLPSGRKLWYWNPQPVRAPMPWDPDDIRPAWTYQAKKMGHLRTIKPHGGLLTENVVQALARDLLVDAMFKCEAERIPIVLTVHDEIVAEVLDRDAHEKLKALGQIMIDTPAWAKALNIPVATECWPEPYERYKK